jgi:hypothetical protein
VIALTKRNGGGQVIVNPDQILYMYEVNQDHETRQTTTVIVFPYAGDSGYGNTPAISELHVTESLTKVRGLINTSCSHKSALHWAQK